MRITRGLVLAQRFFDVADEIDLVRAEAFVKELWRRPPFVGGAKQIRIPDPPLEMALLPRSCGVADLPPAEVMARIYNVGTVAVTFTVELPTPMSPEELILFAARLVEAEEAITDAARPVVQEILNGIRDACEHGGVTKFTEDYTIFVLHQTHPAVDSTQLREELDIARLLLGETLPISAAQREQITQTRFSYYANDLVVVDWNSALIFDPRGDHHVAFILELTSVQLLNLRAYDDLVGSALDQLYGELETKRGHTFAASSYQRLSRRIMQLFVDVREMTDRTETSLQYLGDTWLARIHRAAMVEFDIPRWQKQLRDKLEVLGEINRYVVDQTANSRALGVELAIFFLIFIEIVFFMALEII